MFKKPDLSNPEHLQARPLQEILKANDDADRPANAKALQTVAGCSKPNPKHPRQFGTSPSRRPTA